MVEVTVSDSVASTPRWVMHVAGLDDDAHSLGLQSVGEPVGDLFGQPFLHLRTAGRCSTIRASFDRPRIRSPGR